MDSVEELYDELQLRRIRSSCPTCQAATGANKPCVCHVFCGDVLCQHHPDPFVEEFVMPPVPRFV